MKTFDVVIVGGGFAGAYCARALAKALGRAEGERRVLLIAERNVLVFQPMLAEVAGASLNPTDVVNPLRHFCRGVVVWQGTVQRIDWAGRELEIDGGRFSRNHLVGFKHLVVGLGSVTDNSLVPGMAEYGWPMKSVPEALRLRAAVINRLEEANLVDDPAVKARLLTFVVVGGGYTGVETAGQVLDLVKEASRYYIGLRGVRPKVMLVHGREELLGEIGPELGGYAREVLVKRGVEVRLKTRLTEITATRAHFDDGSSLATSTVVTTIGNAPNPQVLDLARQLGLPTDRGRLVVEPTMRVAGQSTLWSAGDCAAVPWDDRGRRKTAPPTAQFAMRQGAQLGANLARVLRGGDEAALRPFRHRYLGQLASIGERAAVAEVMGLHFRGFVAWWMWRTIYLSKLPGTGRKLRVVIDWTFDLFFPRDISVLQPPPDEPLRNIHLEAGETLCEGGASCRAYYYVRRGAMRWTGAAGETRELGAGTVIDAALLTDDGRWTGTVRAAESSDVVVFRGRALELLQHELKLVPKPRS